MQSTTTPRDARHWLTTSEAAEYIRRPAATLKAWRARRIGPPYVAPSRRVVLYRRDQLDAWLARSSVSTEPDTRRGAA
jgi:hypothetical protein